LGVFDPGVLVYCGTLVGVVGAPQISVLTSMSPQGGTEGDGRGVSGRFCTFLLF